MPRAWTGGLTIPAPAGRAADYGPPMPPAPWPISRAERARPARCCISSSGPTRWRTEYGLFRCEAPHPVPVGGRRGLHQFAAPHIDHRELVMLVGLQALLEGADGIVPVARLVMLAAFPEVIHHIHQV